MAVIGIVITGAVYGLIMLYKVTLETNNSNVAIIDKGLIHCIHVFFIILMFNVFAPLGFAMGVVYR